MKVRNFYCAGTRAQQTEGRLHVFDVLDSPEQGAKVFQKAVQESLDEGIRTDGYLEKDGTFLIKLLLKRWGIGCSNMRRGTEGHHTKHLSMRR